MARGQTTEEFRHQFWLEHPTTADLWAYHGGNPGDPGWVSDAARKFGDQYGLDAEALDDAASGDGWEFHDSAYDEKIEDLAKRFQQSAIEGSVA